ncbi:MAG: ATP-dependent zinc metalloprotease FtsH [Planctomycetes bacterium]|nr:ATP-dependent zinc metalloprotease FtsH [Planctomycetota bacterium]
MLIALGVLLWSLTNTSVPGRELSYARFKEFLRAGEVQTAVVTADLVTGRVIAHDDRAGRVARKDGEPADAFDYNTVRIEDDQLLKELEAHGVDYRGAVDRPSTGYFLIWLLPLIAFPLLLLFLFRARSGGGGGPMGSPFGFGRSRARMHVDKDTGVTFDDVAGCDEAKTDLTEVVGFLRHPERFAKLGARVPKGVLLLGPPGTGKTLLARAVAGEAGVPFFSISGSEFVEMFVGVGAARVRDLFEQAKKSAPCIVFVDEIDAIGRARGVQMGAVNDEREQTLNQLLVELDGFEPNSGVILLAATNRPDVLDRALLRPGRFDRQVVLDAPDFEGRKAILRVHARGKPLAADVDLASIARGTPGFAGADLANALNEAALLASRRAADAVTQQDLQEAIEKIVAGPERRTRRLRDAERRRVAYHETGHALVAWFSEHADPVHKISIVPRGRAALGYTMQLPLEDQYLATRAEIDDRIVGLLGGRAAEEVVFGDVSTGASDDLDRATQLARQLVTVYGMGRSVGLMRCASDPDAAFLRGPGARLQRDCSEATAREIDEEVRAVLDGAYQRALGLLREHRDELERVAHALLERERLEGDEFAELLGDAGRGGGPRGRSGGPAPGSEPR